MPRQTGRGHRPAAPKSSPYRSIPTAGRGTHHADCGERVGHLMCRYWRTSDMPTGRFYVNCRWWRRPRSPIMRARVGSRRETIVPTFVRRAGALMIGAGVVAATLAVASPAYATPTTLYVG